MKNERVLADSIEREKAGIDFFCSNRQDRSRADPLSHECRPRSGKVAFALFSGNAFLADFLAARA